MRFVAKVTLHVFTGDWGQLGLVNNCKPDDKSVVDAASAEAHEYGHVNDIKAEVVSAMDAEEAHPYLSKDDCKKAIKGAIKRVNKKFRDASRNSQTSRK